MTGGGDVGRVVVVGAGQAGGNVARALRSEGFAGEIALLGDEPTNPFGRPPLSKEFLRGNDDLKHWYVRPAAWYADHEVELRHDAAVTRVDVREHRVVLRSGEHVAYDRLVYCAGAAPRVPPLPGVHLGGVHVLRTVADSTAIRRAAVAGARVAIVGTGFIGCEVAASLTQMGARVTAIGPAPGPMGSALGPEMAAVFAGIHRDHGVELVVGERVVAFEGDGGLERVVTGSGRRIECELAVLAVGVGPSVAALVGGVEIGDGVVVDSRCRTSHEHVFAAGDVASHDHPIFGRVRVEHYNNAEKMGRAAARALLGDEKPYAYVHSLWSDQYEHKLEHVGHAPTWDTFVTRGDVAGRTFLGFYLRGGVLRAALGLNRGGDPELDEESELRACAELVRRRAAVAVGHLADEGVDLRGLAAAGDPVSD